jgi:hypothetical protein
MDDTRRVSLGAPRIALGPGQTAALYSNPVAGGAGTAWPSAKGFEPEQVRLSPARTEHVKILRITHEKTGAVYALVPPDPRAVPDDCWELRGGAPLVAPDERLQLDIANDSYEEQMVTVIIFGSMHPRDPRGTARCGVLRPRTHRQDEAS